MNPTTSIAIFNLSDNILSFLFLIIIITFIFLASRSARRNHASSKRNLTQTEGTLPPSSYHYTHKNHIMTRTEEDVFRRLVTVFDQKFYVIPQVHLDALLNFKIKGQNWYGAFQHINRKSVDYILLNKSTLQPICAIELDDFTHLQDKRQYRDREVERIFKEARLPLVRITNIKDYSNRDIIKLFAAAINHQTA